MSLSINENKELKEIVVILLDEELKDKTITYMMEIISTRLADEYIAKYGVQTLKEIGVEELKKEITAKIEARLAELGSKNNENL